MKRPIVTLKDMRDVAVVTVLSVLLMFALFGIPRVIDGPFEPTYWLGVVVAACLFGISWLSAAIAVFRKKTPARQVLFSVIAALFCAGVVWAKCGADTGIDGFTDALMMFAFADLAGNAAFRASRREPDEAATTA